MSDRMMDSPLRWTRRAFLGGAAAGLGRIAFASLGSSGGAARIASPPKVKRVVHLYMAGGPSHLETFDEKPELARLDGQPMPESFTKGQQLAQLQGQELRCLGPRFGFRSFGASGQRVCERFPRLGSVVDELCIVNSMQTDQINHDPAHTLFNTGTTLPGRPSMGSWVHYGLGAMNEDLPAYVVLTSVGKGGQAQPIAARQWHSGFLPSRYQGVELRSQGDPVLYVGNPPGVDRPMQGEVVDAINAMNALHGRSVNDPEIATRTAQNKMAYRMQSSIPKLVDFSDEPD